MKLEKHILSKSTFMRGCQCLKSLWLYKNEYKLRDEISQSQQVIFDRGTSVGELAQQLFPYGIDASPVDAFHYQDSVLETRKLIDKKTPVIYEAAFQFEKVLAAIDILVLKNGKYYAYEVKGSTSVKEQYIKDAALQYWVITNSGIKLEDISIVHLNNKYVRQGELEIKKLFAIKSVLDDGEHLQDEINYQIGIEKEMLKKKEMPQVDIGAHCFSPYDCDFMGHCWKHIPEYSVFDLANVVTEKKFELYQQGIIEIHQIENKNAFSERIQIQIAGEEIILSDEISEFLNEIQYPVCFMDFETFMPAVPIYDGSHSYQMIPFQFSVHRIESENAETKHFEFLGSPQVDPRRKFVEELIAATKNAKTILAYNKSFENTRLNELSNDFPEYAKDIATIQSKMLDLMTPFQKRWYYKPEMRGSYSIKLVLPALIPDLNYDELEIAEGGAASNAFESLLFITDENKVAEIRNALLEYCKMDTLAMVRIWEHLKTV